MKVRKNIVTHKFEEIDVNTKFYIKWKLPKAYFGLKKFREQKF